MSILGPMTLLSHGDTSWSKVCMMLLVTFLSFLSEFLLRNHHHFNLEKLLRLRKTQYKIQCNVVYKHNTYYDCTISLPYKAVMSFLYRKILEDTTTKVKYHIIDEVTNYSLKPIKLVLFDNPRTKYKINEYVYISHTESEDRSEKGEYLYKTYTIEMSSTRKNLNDIMDFIREALAIYDDKQEHDMLNKTHVYVLNGFEENTNVPMYDELEFATTKTFDNMFFGKKTALIHRLDDFESSESRYKRLGIPYTLGFMFHGKPGTGKTSAIKAIAHHTKRNIIIIPVKKVNNVDKLKKLFMSERINDIKVPMKKRLYVFEEIDCSQWRSVVLSRDHDSCSSLLQDSAYASGASTPDTLQITKEIVSTLKDIKKSDPKTMVLKEDKGEFELTLGDLLDILDGMIEMPGRMIVMTSNHPEIIDSALLRPGRMDMAVEFKEMSQEDIGHMYELWFEKPLPFAIEHVKKGVYTQADIGNIFSMVDHEKVLEAIYDGDIRDM